MLLILLAYALPGLFLDQGPETSAAIKTAGIERVYTDQAAVADRKKVPAPGVQYRTNVASATRVPWVDANGWRFLREPTGKYYYDIPGGPVALAAAEAFAYGADAVIHAAPGELQAFAQMLAFLRKVDHPRLPVLANIGVIDDGSARSGEVLNLLARRNLLFRVLSAPDPKLDLNIQAGPDADNPSLFAAKVRQQLGDEKRLLRIYGSEVVLGLLTGDGRAARLHLLNYGGRKIEGLRIRLRGSYPTAKLMTSDLKSASPADMSIQDGGMEFSIPEMEAYAIVDLER
jgi:hypothetical protein